MQAFKSIVSRIHPQIALSPQETHRLLNALTTSFRRQLDHDHLSPQLTAPAAQSFAGTQLKVAESHASPTDLHLASVLTYPLLANSPNESSATKSARHAVVREKKHPIKVFEEHVANGMATLDTARLCLEAFRSSLSSLTADAKQVQIRKLDAGARVLRWIWSTQAEVSEVVANGPSLLRDLSYFLVAEGREGAMWEWMESMPQSVVISLLGKDTSTADPRGLLLRFIVTAHMSNVAGGGPESALRSFDRALELSSSVPSTSKSTSSSIAFLRPAATYLFRKLLAPSTSRPSTKEYATLFDKFVHFYRVWDQHLGKKLSFKVATLQLNHPLAPSTSEAMEIIRMISRNPSLWSSELLTSKKRASLVRLCFATTDMLHQQRCNEDAAWVMDFMIQHFGKDILGDDRGTQTAKVQQEQNSAAQRNSHDVWQSLDWRVPVPG